MIIIMNILFFLPSSKENISLMTKQKNKNLNNIIITKPQNKNLNDLLKRINAKSHFNLSSNELNNIKIGVIDTGITNSSSLSMELVNSTLNKEDEPHGNAIIGIIGAKETNQNKYEGILPGVQITAYNIPFDQLNTMNIAKGIDALIKEGVDVINISLSTTEDNSLLLKSVKVAINSGITVVCSSGNSSDNVKYYPAAYNISGVISVGALNKDLNILDASTVNPEVDIFAPGEEVYSIWNNNDGIKQFSGTSVSAPFVTALVALLKSKCNTYTPKKLEDIIKKSSYKYQGKWGLDDKIIYLINVDNTINNIHCEKKN
jgi:subtilisin family serine protease